MSIHNFPAELEKNREINIMQGGLGEGWAAVNGTGVRKVGRGFGFKNCT
jgi:hypothetical protein